MNELKIYEAAAKLAQDFDLDTLGSDVLVEPLTVLYDMNWKKAERLMAEIDCPDLEEGEPLAELAHSIANMIGTLSDDALAGACPETEGDADMMSHRFEYQIHLAQRNIERLGNAFFQLLDA